MDNNEDSQNPEEFQGTQELQFADEGDDPMEVERSSIELHLSGGDDDLEPSPKRFCPMQKEEEEGEPAKTTLQQKKSADDGGKADGIIPGTAPGSCPQSSDKMPDLTGEEIPETEGDWSLCLSLTDTATDAEVSKDDPNSKDDGRSKKDSETGVDCERQANVKISGIENSKSEVKDSEKECAGEAERGENIEASVAESNEVKDSKIIAENSSDISEELPKDESIMKEQKGVADVKATDNEGKVEDIVAAEVSNGELQEDAGKDGADIIATEASKDDGKAADSAETVVVKAEEGIAVAVETNMEEHKSEANVSETGRESDNTTETNADVADSETSPNENLKETSVAETTTEKNLTDAVAQINVKETADASNENLENKEDVIQVSIDATLDVDDDDATNTDNARKSSPKDDGAFTEFEVAEEPGGQEMPAVTNSSKEGGTSTKHDTNKMDVEVAGSEASINDADEQLADADIIVKDGDDIQEGGSKNSATEAISSGETKNEGDVFKDSKPSGAEMLEDSNGVFKKQDANSVMTTTTDAKVVSEETINVTEGSKDVPNESENECKTVEQEDEAMVEDSLDAGKESSTVKLGTETVEKEAERVDDAGDMLEDDTVVKDEEQRNEAMIMETEEDRKDDDAIKDSETPNEENNITMEDGKFVNESETDDNEGISKEDKTMAVAKENETVAVAKENETDTIAKERETVTDITMMNSETVADSHDMIVADSDTASNDKEMVISNNEPDLQSKVFENNLKVINSEEVFSSSLKLSDDSEVMETGGVDDSVEVQNESLNKQKLSAEKSLADVEMKEENKITDDQEAKSAQEAQSQNEKPACENTFVGSFWSPPETSCTPNDLQTSEQAQFVIKKPLESDDCSMPTVGSSQDTPGAKAFAEMHKIMINEDPTNVVEPSNNVTNPSNNNPNSGSESEGTDSKINQEPASLTNDSVESTVPVEGVPLSSITESTSTSNCKEVSDVDSPLVVVKQVVGRQQAVISSSEDSDMTKQQNAINEVALDDADNRCPDASDSSSSTSLSLVNAEKTPQKDKIQEGKASEVAELPFKHARASDSDETIELPRKKICIDRGVSVSSPAMETRGVQVSISLPEEHLIASNFADVASSIKPRRVMVQVITRVRHITTKEYVKDGKVVKKSVKEEEDDPVFEEMEWDDSLSSPPASGSSRTTISSLPGSGELADISSLTSKSTSSSSIGAKSTQCSISPPLSNFTLANSPSTQFSPPEKEHSPFHLKRWSDLLTQTTPKRGVKVASPRMRKSLEKKSPVPEESSNQLMHNETSDDDSFKLPSKVYRRVSTPKNGGRKKKTMKPEGPSPSPVKAKPSPKLVKKESTSPAISNVTSTVAKSAESPALSSSQGATSDGQASPPPPSQKPNEPQECEAIDELLPAPGPESTSNKYVLPGMRVMARWMDGCYYSGIVKSQTDDGRWLVLYDDKQTRVVHEEDMIVVPVLDVGQSVLVPSASGFYDAGIIKGRFRQGTEVGYIVEKDNGVTKRFARSEVVLSSDQADTIIGNSRSRNKSSAEVSLENIVEGKRRRSGGSFGTAGRALSESRKQARGKLKKPDPNLDSTATDTCEDSTKSVDAPDESQQKKVTFSVTEKGTKSGGKGTHKSKASSSASTDERSKPATKKKVEQQHSSSDDAKSTHRQSEERNMGPLLPSGSTLFKEFACLLSYAERKPDSSQKDVSSSIDSEDEGESNPTLPFDKAHLKAQIESGGGVVLERFEQTQTIQKQVLLIASSHLRTIKYIQCIAAGIPCVSHHWVKDCISVNRINNYTSYLLPAGYSIVSRSLIEWHSKTNALQGMHILLVSTSNDQFIDTWTPVLLAARADVVRRLPTAGTVGSSLNVDIIVTDPSCPTQILRRAANMGIPVVSSEWIIQCLITGQRLKPEAHPKFRHSYTK